ncbi:MAG TPA: zf-HC2 domain-containing protein, partial [Ktedonobacterales bacterium]
MNCKWAEGQLSASVDGTLDPAVREEVGAHVESCANCSSILAEYRYFDGLLRELPRYEPADTLRERIFDSPEFAAIVRSLDGTSASRPATRWPILSRPSSIARPTRGDDAGRRGHDRPLDPLPFPTPPAEQDPPATPGAPTGAPRHGPGGAPPWVRVAISAAAAVAIVVGSALLIKQGLSHSPTAHTPGICVDGCPNGYRPKPLAAGPRVVFLRDGALWSAPEQGTGAAQLTPTTVVVAPGWTVAPLHDGSGGDSVAYIDLKTGALHVVRSDDQRDHVVVKRLVAQPGAVTWA